MPSDLVWYVLQNQKETLPTWIAQSNGRLELNRIDVASLYPGRVKAVLVEEGADVKEGDILAELSSETSNSHFLCLCKLLLSCIIFSMKICVSHTQL